MDQPLPTGTVTFLFTDIEDSASLWERYPDGMKEALVCHDDILSTAVEAHRGRVVKTTGDGCYAAFATAAEGVAAAHAAQQALHVEGWGNLQPESLRVRMGLHTGEAELRDGDYHGQAVNRAARLMSVGYGGQILLSGLTAALVEGTLPAGVTLLDLGEHRLKGLIRPERVFQLLAPGLPADFPPLRSAGVSAVNLP
jgi:class 3 adenylate cyclase